VDDAILANAAFLRQIVANPEIFENSGPSESEEDGDDVGESLDEPRDEGLDLLLSLTTNDERSQHAQEKRGALCRLIPAPTPTHMGARTSKLTHTPMDPTPILPRAKKILGADADR
jgi:hypothetical protein